MRWEYIQLTGRANASSLATTSHTPAAATASAGAQASATAALVQAHPYPTYLPGNGHLFWYDPMASSANWETGENKDNTGACGLTGGIYHTTRTKPGFRWCVGGYALGQLGNFAFEIHVTIVKGDCGGIEFRENDQTFEAYMFIICRGGQEDLYKYLPAHDILQYLVGSINSSAIHTGLSQDNVLDVVAQGSLLTLFINQHQVGQVQDSSNQKGYLGTAAVEQSASTDVTFQDATVWTL